MLAQAAKFAIQLSPDALGCAIATALATRIRPLPATAPEQAALASARRLTYGNEDRHAAWSWGEGPRVLLAHGWGGSASQMAPLA